MKIHELFKKQKCVSDYLKVIEKEQYNINLYNCSLNHGIMFTYLSFLEKQTNVVYVAENSYKASHAYETFCHLASPENVSFYTTDEIISTELVAVSSEFRFERINTIKAIIEGKPKIIVTHLQPLLRPLVALDEIKNSVIEIHKSDIIDIAKLTKSLVKAGYKKRPTCDLVGEFAVRGEIIDIFPIFSEYPVRVDFFDNEVDFIKYYDPETQKSSLKINDVQIYPINDLIYSEEERDRALKIIEKSEKNTEEIAQDLEDLNNFSNPERVTKYIEYIKEKHFNFLDYLSEKIVFFEDFSSLKNNYFNLMVEVENISKKTLLKLIYFDDFYTVLNSKKQVFLTEFASSLEGIILNNIIDTNGFRVTDYQSGIKGFIEDLKLISKEKTYLILASDQRHYEMINSILETNVSYKKITDLDQMFGNNIYLGLVSNAISFGFPDITVITENELFKNIIYKKARFESSKYSSISINSKDDLKAGDYVVHIDYGIGIYLGLKTVELNNIKNDYLVIKYDNLDLYVPVEKIDRLEKYQGSEGTAPKLSKVGTDEWKKKKNKIKEKVESIARDLISTQIERTSKKGYVYPTDEELQKDFESNFEYDLTHDQEESIKDIKKDMEAGLIIDRLICGDVGYGKTEIAMRAAFKTVLAGKQVAYLAPTTILARQHYYTFLERFEKYGVSVKMLNRLVDTKEQTNILKQLKNHKVDIIIGTHRLLSNDVSFDDLGLLIIDEEQRFGVVHKEKIKQLKTDINVLTLTATPIPRTLQMSIMGVRQFSLIQTPPQNRYPIQTYVLEFNENVVKEAIYKELSRKGQVFYLHNNISTLPIVIKKIKKLVPEARICFAHGRMVKEDLEDIIQSFIDKEYDVLVCTTIIETGIDIPNSNTLIIDQTDRLGLAQLYQIRGRIGRSDRIAYAYLMYEKGKVLTKAGVQRLNAIKEFTNLGSGYKIALRDLAIRGAGDILGSEQSGFIDMVGMDMYMKMLNESISRLKGEELPKEAIKYNVQISKHVSEEYVSDEEIKILIHEKINSITSIMQKKELIEELVDRFGKLSDEILLYIEEKYLESLLNHFGIPEVIEEDNYIKIVFPETTSNKVDGSKMFSIANKLSREFYFSYKNKQLTICLNKTAGDKKWVYLFARLLEQL